MRAQVTEFLFKHATLYLKCDFSCAKDSQADLLFIQMVWKQKWPSAHCWQHCILTFKFIYESWLPGSEFSAVRPCARLLSALFWFFVRSKLTHFLLRTRGHRSRICRSSSSVSSVTGRRQAHASAPLRALRTRKYPQSREWKSLNESWQGSSEQTSMNSSSSSCSVPSPGLSSSVLFLLSAPLSPSTPQRVMKSSAVRVSFLLG